MLALAIGCSQPARPPVLQSPDLDVPEVIAMYVPPDAVPVHTPPTTCGGDAVTITRMRAEVIFLIDRSGSMVNPTTDGAEKWTALGTALHDFLPRIEANISMGMMAFPRPQSSGGAVSPEVVCGVPAVLDVQPNYGNASAILSVVMRYPPSGATPTFAALSAAAQYYSTEPDRSGQHYLVLATDGGPNCNAAFDNHTCRCSDVDVLCRNDMNTFARYNCLDDARTITEIRAIAGMGVPTYVIGLPGSEGLGDVLNAMADAGGRPRSGATHYYSVQTAGDLATQFASITTGLVECSFHLASAPPDPNLVDVRFDDRSLIHDPTHQNGWDWADETHQLVAFYGATCNQLRFASGGDRISAVFGCPAPAPP